MVVYPTWPKANDLLPEASHNHVNLFTKTLPPILRTDIFFILLRRLLSSYFFISTELFYFICNYISSNE